MDDTRPFSQKREQICAVITDTASRVCFPEASHLPEDESTTHGVYFQSKPAEETIVQTADPDVPVLKPQTAEAAIKIIDPTGVAGTVNVILHEHSLRYCVPSSTTF